MRLPALVAACVSVLASCSVKTDERIASAARAIDGGSGLAQVILAAGEGANIQVSGGNLGGVGVVLPPGGLSLPITLEISEATAINGDVAADLGVSISSALSRAVAILPSADASTTTLQQPMALSIPILSAEAKLLGDTNYAVAFRCWIKGEVQTGLIKGQSLSIVDNTAKFSAKWFGVFQVVSVPDEVADAEIETRPSSRTIEGGSGGDDGGGGDGDVDPPTPFLIQQVDSFALAVSDLQDIDTIQVSWTPFDGASFYDLKVGMDPGCQELASEEHHYTDLTGTSHVIDPLAEGKYYLCLRAIEASGAELAAPENDGMPFRIGWGLVSTTNAPSARFGHTAVWTGSRMIIWGGTSNDSAGLKTGAMYDPATDTWSALTTTDAPDGRWDHSAVWTGAEMVVFGGRSGVSSYLNSAAAYNPETNQWRPLPGATNSRYGHVSVYDNNGKMYVFGGFGESNSYITIPEVLDVTAAVPAWTQLAEDPATTGSGGSIKGRMDLSAILAGDEIMTFGGRYGLLDSSGLNNHAQSFASPQQAGNAAGSWSALGGAVPPARFGHHAFWTGWEMLIFGGATISTGPEYAYLTDLQLYDPSGNSGAGAWSEGDAIIDSIDGFEGRIHSAAAWVGYGMVVWGGGNFRGDMISTGVKADGAFYDHLLGTWTALPPVPESPVAFAARRSHTGVWTGSAFIVWGGDTGVSSTPTAANTGAILGL